MDKGQVIALILQYLVPTATIVGLVGQVADFALKEVVGSWRGLVVVAVTAVAYFLAPHWTIWIGLVVLGAFIGHRIWLYTRGPQTRNDVVFAGFYTTTGSQGKLSRSGVCSKLDARMFDVMRTSLQKHRVQSVSPTKAIEFKPPRVIYSRYDYEDMNRLMNRYATKALGVVWGTVGDDGSLASVEVGVDTSRYHGRDMIKAFLEDVNKAAVALGNDAGVDLSARALAAMWGHVHCEVLNQAGRWQESLMLATDSRLVFEKVLSAAGRDGHNSPVVDNARMRLLPLFLLQEAIALHHGGRHLDALDKLYQILVISPYWPFYGSTDFAEFYANRYTATWARRPGASEHLGKYLAMIEERAMLTVLPPIHLFTMWLAATGCDEAATATVAKWFSILSNRHPDNAFVYLYWGESIKAIWMGNHPDSPDGLPLDVLEQVASKLELAYQCPPHYPIIASRLAGVYMSTLRYLNEGSPEHSRRVEHAMRYFKLGVPYYYESVPMTLATT